VGKEIYKFSGEAVEGDKLSQRIYYHEKKVEIWKEKREYNGKVQR
jgi:hypothetical protein